MTDEADKRDGQGEAPDADPRAPAAGAGDAPAAGAPDGGDGRAQATGEAPAATDGVGATLRSARERLGLSQHDMAARLRLHPRQVAALEDERFDTLPAGPFLRGFVRNYARELRLDPAPLLALLALQRPASAASLSLGTLADTGVVSSEVRRVGVERMSRAAVIGGGIALLLLLGLIGWVTSIRMQHAHTAAPAAAPPAAIEAPAADGAPDEPPPPLLPASPPPAVPADPVAPAAGGAAPVAAGALRLTIGERPSWIEIAQADGTVLFTGLLEAHTQRQLGNLQPPLRLVIGNAPSVTLEYRGRVVDLAPHSRSDGLARLTLE